MALNKTHIAVLPLQDVGATTNYLGEGISSELIYRLTQIPELAVIAKTSSFMFREGNTSLEEIASKLNVELLVEGTCQQVGEKIRINIQLIRCSDGNTEWSYRTDTTLDNIFEAQDQLSEQLVEALKIKLKPDQEFKKDGQKLSPELYKKYLHAQHQAYKWTPHNAETSVELYEEIVKEVPDFAIGYAGLAHSLSVRNVVKGSDFESTVKRITKCIKKSLELDPDLSEAHAALGFNQFVNEANLEGAHMSFKKALALSPGSAEVHHLFSFYLNCIQENALATKAMETAVSLDPLSVQVNSTYAYCLMAEERYDEAILQFEKTIDLDPESESAYLSMGFAYFFKGEPEKALECVQRFLTFPFCIAAKGFFFARLNRIEEAKSTLDELSDVEKQNDSQFPLLRSLVYLGLGDLKTTSKCLAEAFKLKNSFLIVLAHPAWKEFRATPHFDRYKKYYRLRHLKPEYNPDNREENVIFGLLTATKQKVKVPLNDLLYVEADDNYCKLYYNKDGEVHHELIRSTLSAIQDQLTHPDIIRCHRSFLINRNAGFTLTGKAQSMRLESSFDPQLKIPVSRFAEKEIESILG